MELTTSRLLLRDFRPDDQEVARSLADDPSATRHTAWGSLTAREIAAEVQAMIEAALEEHRVRYGLAVADRSTGEVIGWIQLQQVSSQDRRAAMAFAFGQPSWGRGYATEAANAMVGFAFDTLKMRKITATCSPQNPASSRVLTKIGMRLEGYLHDHALVGDTWQDRLLFALITGRN